MFCALLCLPSEDLLLCSVSVVAPTTAWWVLWFPAGVLVRRAFRFPVSFLKFSSGVQEACVPQVNDVKEE